MKLNNSFKNQSGVVTVAFMLIGMWVAGLFGHFTLSQIEEARKHQSDPVVNRLALKKLGYWTGKFNGRDIPTYKELDVR